MVIPQKNLNAAPAFWKIAGVKGNIFILGTLHLLPEKCRWITPLIANSLNDSQYFIGEVPDINELNEFFSKQQETGGGCLSATALKSLLSPAHFSKLLSLMDGIGMPPEIWQNYKPWFMTNFLAGKIWEKNGYLTDFGVEGSLNRLIKNEDKICFGLETPEMQLKIFDDLTLETQLQRLQITIDFAQQLGPAFEGYYKAWGSGDLNLIYNSIVEPMKTTREFYDALFPKRHPSWVRQIEKFLEIPGNFFMAAGVNHFLGSDSVLLDLEDLGYQITRIQ